VLFAKPKGSDFPVLVNLYGTERRVERIFADTLDRVRRLVELKLDPTAALRNPARYWRSPLDALTMLPKRVRNGPALTRSIPLSRLPQVVSWPGDGGPFITLPAVYTEHPDRPGTKHSNLGMYRVQLAGNAYEADREVGLHYQLHRGIGVHHAAALARGEPLRVAIFVGGSPALPVSAVMPLPEGLSELTFAGALAGHRIPMIARKGRPAIYADADFVIEGTVRPGSTKPEGPFGDHLGYYARQHDFPLLEVDHVWHREGAIWPVTVVGRPPQEDTLFGWLVHELTGPVIPTVLPGVSSVHAVDASGVHPLLLAVGSERYLPWKRSDRPAELLTQASAILGQGQLSLAKYLFIVNGGEAPGLDAHDVEPFLAHLLARVDWARDCHFHTETTIDTLDYSGSGFNAGSKLVVAARGPERRSLARELPAAVSLPDGFTNPRLCLPGVVAVQGPRIEPVVGRRGEVHRGDRTRPSAPRGAAAGDRRRLGIRRGVAGQLPLAHVHAVEPRGRCPRGGQLRRAQALGLHGAARDRRAAQAAPRAARRGGSDRHSRRGRALPPGRPARRTGALKPQAEIEAIRTFVEIDRWPVRRR
jgi:4-hydroxy-3-polyprenylbenzoate decarboxylase